MLSQLHGKPFTITLNGKARTIGKITDAYINPARTTLGVSIEMTDEEVAGILGAAQDKAEAAESPIGLSNAEIDAAIAIAREDLGNDPGPFAARFSPDETLHVGAQTGRMSMRNPNLSR